MANKSNQNEKMNSGEMALVGAGIAAVAAGAYFFFGPDGKKHQKKMRGWMVRMKGDVLERLEEAQEVSEPIYHEIVDTVAKTYEVAGKIPHEEILGLASDLKKQWRTIKRTAFAPKKQGQKKTTTSRSKTTTTKTRSKKTSKR
jgi:hypothetical protein